MYTQKEATLTMRTPLVESTELDTNVYRCEVLEYDESKEKILLQLKGSKIQNLTLNAMYECQILLEEKGILCTGLIRERYIDERGCILNFRVESGFYEISIK